MFEYNGCEIETFTDEQGTWVLFNNYIIAIGGSVRSGASHIGYYQDQYGLDIPTEKFHSQYTNRPNICVRVADLHKLAFGKINMRKHHTILHKILERRYMATPQAVTLSKEMSLTGTPQDLPNEKDIRIQRLERHLQDANKALHNKADRIAELEKQLAAKTANSHHVPLNEVLRREGLGINVYPL